MLLKQLIQLLLLIIPLVLFAQMEPKFNESYITASFSLKNEKNRSLKLYDSVIPNPAHAIVLVPKENTFYILNFETKKLLGKFTLPKRGAPRYIKISPDKNGFTKINYEFRVLPKKGIRGRPGPLIRKELVYKDGVYSE